MLGSILGHRRSGKNLGGSLSAVFLEVLIEELTQFVNLILEAGRAGPAALGVEQFAGDVGAGLGDVEVEGVVGLVLDVGELAGVDGVEDGASVFERATFAAGGAASTDPAGVQQPSVSLVLGDLVSEHAGVAHWVKGQEGLGEAGGESGLGFSDTILSASHLGGVTGDEVEHGLFGGEFRDWWEDTASIAGKEDDVGWVLFSQARNLGILNVLNGIGAGEAN